MPNRVQWNSGYAVGNETLDDQHRDILARCNALADCLDDGSEDGDRRFDEIFTALMALAREHFAAEETLIAGFGQPALDDHRSEQEEFNFLAAEIITPKNFDKSELQTFLTLWWTGHVMGAARNYRAFLEDQQSSP